MHTIDFTSALYLGLPHASHELEPWPRLTLGKPAALADPPGADAVERELARLTGCEAAVLGPSTLHLFVDLFAMLGGPGQAVFLDGGAYPIAERCARMAAASGALVQPFRRHDPEALWRAMAGWRDVRPIVVTDGVCPARGVLAPLGEYAKAARVRHGLVVIDDTQALGVLGESGGGSLRAASLDPRGVVLVSSMAKAFGVPVAMLGGSRGLVERFRRESFTRVHSSPPSVAVIAAAAHALDVNRAEGDHRRQRLAGLVARFRQRLATELLSESLFPVQSMRMQGSAAVELHRRLKENGVDAVLHRGGAGARLSFLITAAHVPADIDRAVQALGKAGGQNESIQLRGWAVR